MSIEISHNVSGYIGPAELDEAELARQELTGVLELVPPLYIGAVVARNRKDYDIRRNRLPSGALVIDCQIEGGEQPMEGRVIIDDTHRTLSQDTITFLGAEAIQRQHRGDFIYNTVS